MSEWQHLKLGELITLNYGKALKAEDRKPGNVPVFSSAGQTGTHDQCLVNSEGIIIGRKGTVGKVYYSAEPFCCIDTAYYITPKPESYNFQYLYYMLQTLGLEELNEDSAVPGLNRDTAYNQEVTLPPLPEQKAIASVLSSLDDKIDLLHRQNKTLEAMAETLLIQHVLPREDEQNDGLYLLGDYLETISVTHKFPNPQVIFLNTSDIYKGKVLTQELSDVKGLPGQAKKSIKKGDILFSEIRPANGRYALIDFDADNYVVSTKLMVLRAKQPKLIGLLYFYLTNKQVTDWLQVLAESRSGTFPQITFDQVADLELRLPQESDLDNLIELLDDILLKQSANNKQIQTLGNLRDTLLPKLMSGEVRVQYQTEEVA